MVQKRSLVTFDKWLVMATHKGPMMEEKTLINLSSWHSANICNVFLKIIYNQICSS